MAILRRLTLRNQYSGFAGLLMIAAPVLWIVAYSLLYSTGLIGLLSQGLTLEHWTTALRSGAVVSSMVYSGTIAGTVTILTASVAVGFVVLCPEVRHSKPLTAVLCVPMATPSIVMAFVTYLILNPGGLVARICCHLGLLRTPSEFPELVNDRWALGIIAAAFLGQFPILTLYLLKTWTFAGIDRYCRLAASLGLSAWQTRWRVAVPMLTGRGRSMFLLCFLWTLGLFEIPLLLGVQHPMMYSVLVQKRSGQFNLLQRPEAFVHATIYFVLVSIGLMLLTAWGQRDA